MVVFSWLWAILSPTFVERMALRSGGNPVAGADTVEFEPGERTIYCAILLSKPTLRTKLKFEWQAVDVEGMVGPMATIDYKTKPTERFVSVYLSLPCDWPKGAYRVAAYLDGVLAKTIDFAIVTPESLMS